MLHSPSHYQRTVVALTAQTLLALGLILAPTAAFAAEAESQTPEALVEQQEQAVPTEDTNAPSSEQITAPAQDGQESLPAEQTGTVAGTESTSEPTSDTPATDPSPTAEAQPSEQGVDNTSQQADPADEAPADPSASEVTPAQEQDPQAEPQESEGAAAEDEQEPEAASIATDAAGKTFFIESSKSDSLVTEAAGGKMTKGTNVHAYTYNKSVAQQWKFLTSGKYDASGNPYYIIASAKDTSMVLDVQGGKAVNGANVRLWKSNGSDAQLWALRVVNEGLDLVSIVSKLSEMAGKTLVIELKDGKTTNKTNMQLYTSNNSTAQRFYLVNAKPQVSAGEQLPDGDGVYSMRLNSSTGFTTDIKSGSKSNGGNVQLWSYNGSDAQRLIFKYDGAGFYTIGILGSAKVFDVAGGKLMPGTNVQQWTANGSNAQKWALHKNSNGSYTLTNKATGLVLDLAGGNVAKGSNLQGYRALNSSRQQFKLIKDTRSVIPVGIVTISPFANTNMVFDVANGSNTDGGKIQLWTSNGSLAQRFEVVEVSENTYRIRTAASGGWLTGNGATKQVTQMGSSATQNTADLWKLVWDNGGYFSLQNVKSGAVLDMRSGSTAKGAVVQLYVSKGVAAQHFVFKKADLIGNGVYYIRSYHGTNLDVANGSTKPNNIQAYTAKTTTDAQRFQITKSGAGYKIVNLKSGLPVSVSSLDDFGNVTQKRDKGTSLQLWKPAIGDGGYLKFVNVATGKALAARSSAAGSNVVQRTQGAAGKGERWKLVATSGTVQHPAQAKTRILMIGNSLTYRTNSTANNYLPAAVQRLMKGSTEVAYVSALGEDLSFQIKDETSDETKLTAAMKMLMGLIPDASNRAKNSNGKEIMYWDTSCGTGDWDYVVIQDRSDIAITDLPAFLNNVEKASTFASSYGATPILYATWSYSDRGPDGEPSSNGQKLLDDLGCTRPEMDEGLISAFNTAQRFVRAIADVRAKFAERADYWNLFAKDCKHASSGGTELAAQTIVETLKKLIG